MACGAACPRHVEMRSCLAGHFARPLRKVLTQNRSPYHALRCGRGRELPPPGAASGMAGAAEQARAGRRPVILFDVMDTLVVDPFFHDMPKFFQCTFKELIAWKHPTAWVEFETGHISEEELFAKFFIDGREFDGAALVQHMTAAYRYVDGAEPLLRALRSAGYELHACSNYPAWWRHIESKLELSRYLRWTFLSCEGPMAGLRKPAPAAYAAAARHLGLPPHQLLLVDDRAVNVEGARGAGLQAVRFEGAQRLEADLRALGLEF